MKPSKTETKPPSSTMSFHGNVLLHNSQNSSRHPGPSSPTFAKEACAKPLSEDHYHIFGFASDPTASTPTPSLDDLTMSLSMSSHSSNHSSIDKMHASFNSVGLPSDYPLHRNSTSFSSVTLEEELADFELFDDESVTKKGAQPFSFSSITDQNPLECQLPPSSPARGTAPDVKNDMKRMNHHRRNRTEVGSFDGLAAIAKPSRGHRRRNNRALGAKDFHESVLTELFEDVSANEFSY